MMQFRTMTSSNVGATQWLMTGETKPPLTYHMRGTDCESTTWEAVGVREQVFWRCGHKHKSCNAARRCLRRNGH